jgi:hypothetical protein
LQTFPKLADRRRPAQVNSSSIPRIPDSSIVAHVIDHVPGTHLIVILALKTLQEEDLGFAIVLDAKNRAGDIVPIGVIHTRLLGLALATGVKKEIDGMRDRSGGQAQGHKCNAGHELLHNCLLCSVADGSSAAAQARLLAPEEEANDELMMETR